MNFANEGKRGWYKRIERGHIVMGRRQEMSISKTTRLVGCIFSAIFSVCTNWMNSIEARNQLHPYMEYAFPTGDEIFQKEGAPCKKKIIVLEGGVKNELQLISQPPNSVDLNLIRLI
ncbi:hypothetical protein TNCV_3415461 [Trichonephila clavipes]|nr:hypothetical protein TNCV_3415461 [Trichonephila clavipes]